MNHSAEKEFVPLNIAIMTVSDTRNASNDTSGDKLCELLSKSGHNLAERVLVKDDIYQIRAVLSQWIVDPNVHTVITTGGTGFSLRDSTPEAVTPLLDKQVDGFGELFRAKSFELIGTSTMQSRAFAGLANRTLIVCLPGSTGACKDGWSIIESQLDARHNPCNFVGHLRPETVACDSREGS